MVEVMGPENMAYCNMAGEHGLLQDLSQARHQGQLLRLRGEHRLAQLLSGEAVGQGGGCQVSPMWHPSG